MSPQKNKQNRKKPTDMEPKDRQLNPDSDTTGAHDLWRDNENDDVAERIDMSEGEGISGGWRVGKDDEDRARGKSHKNR